MRASIGAVRGTREARAAGGKGSNQRLTVMSSDAAPSTPATNVEESPDMPPSPLTLGDGTEFEDTDADPFVVDDAGIFTAEEIPWDDGGGAP